MMATSFITTRLWQFGDEHRASSERDARGAKRAPKALGIVDRRGACPSAGMIVTVDAAVVGAAARCIELLAVHSVTAPIAPRGVAAEATNRRPIRHRRRRRDIEAREHAGRV